MLCCWALAKDVAPRRRNNLVGERAKRFGHNSGKHTSHLQVLADHLRRTAAALAGFKLFGAHWWRPWLYYFVSPLLSRVLLRSTARFRGFNVRLGEGDLYTFANLFEDYPVPLIERALTDVESVIDLGANVGAFSFLVETLLQKRAVRMPIIAVEPNSANVAFLRQQPFAKSLQIHHAAVGPAVGVGRLVRGRNSVTDHVDFAGAAEGAAIQVLSLRSLCDRPALVKMDIEGGEHEILRSGLPDDVRHLVLEWHSEPGSRSTSLPVDLVAGNWTLICHDIHGSSMWYWRR